MEFIPVAALALLTLKLMDFLRYAVNRDVNGVVSQLVVWAAGVAGLFLASRTAWAGALIIGGIALSKLSFWSLVFYGMSTASASSVIKDGLKAVDNHNTARIPTLLPAGPVGVVVNPGVPGESAG